MTDPIQAAMREADEAVRRLASAAFPNSPSKAAMEYPTVLVVRAAIRSLAALVRESRIAGMEWAANYFTVAARGYAEVPMDGFYKELERLRCLPESREEKP